MVSVGGQRNREVQIGSTVELSCNLPAGSTGRVEWKRDRGDLPPTAFKTNSNKLELTNVQPSDAGRYICELTSQQGRTSDYVVLTVKSKRVAAIREAIGRQTAHYRRRPSSRHNNP